MPPFSLAAHYTLHFPPIISKLRCDPGPPDWNFAPRRPNGAQSPHVIRDAPISIQSEAYLAPPENRADRGSFVEGGLHLLLLWQQVLRAFHPWTMDSIPRKWGCVIWITWWRCEQPQGAGSMSPRHSHCQRQATACARRAEIGGSPKIGSYCRSLEFRWLEACRDVHETGGATGFTSVNGTLFRCTDNQPSAYAGQNTKTSGILIARALLVVATDQQCTQSDRRPSP